MTSADKASGVDVRLKDRVRYAVDNAFSRGERTILLALVVIVVLATLASTFFAVVSGISGIRGGGPQSYGDAIWESLLRAIGKGVHGNDAGWAARILSLLMMVVGLLVGGMLIGLITSWFRERTLSLRKGRSRVIEDDHTVILGWSARVPSIVSELVVANASRKKAAIVVLADKDKSAMEDELRDRIGDAGSTRFVCRSGSISSPHDLALVNITRARSVIVVGGNDASIVKALLAIRATGASAPVVAEVTDRAIARSVRELFDGQVTIVNGDATVADLTAQACRQRGLSQVLRELLDFAGDEIYMAPFPQLEGKTFAEAMLSFESSTALGLLTAGGDVVLNPPAATVIARGDQVIAIAADDSTFTFTGPTPAARTLTTTTTAERIDARRSILVGWNALAPRVVAEIDKFAPAGHVLDVLVDPDIADVESVRSSLSTGATTVTVHAGSVSPEAVAAFASSRPFSEVIVLGRSEGQSAESADAHTLLVLMALNRLVKAENLQSVRVVAELLESQHSPLAEATGVDDFIVSDELGSLLIAQIAERQELESVFSQLFDYEGANVELAPADRYGASQASTFADVVAAAATVGHTALGYRLAADRVVKLNPPKSARLALTGDDDIVVLRTTTPSIDNPTSAETATATADRPATLEAAMALDWDQTLAVERPRR